MKRNAWNVAIVLALFGAALTAAEPPVAPVPLPAQAQSSAPAAVPDWALGVLAFRQFGKAFERLGAYSGQVVPNAGELVRQSAMQALFKVPVTDGIKNDAPGFIYPLDPVATNLSDEQAVVLPVADPAALKVALINTLGMPKEEAGTLTFTVPQPLPLPDKTLLVRIENERMLVAPTAEILKSLTDWIAKAKPEELLGANPGDLALTLKAERFKRLFGKALEQSLSWGVTLATQTPEQAEKLNAQITKALDLLWQIDVAEVRLAFDDKNTTIALELNVRARAGSELAGIFQKGLGTVAGRTLRFLPAAAPVLANWWMDGGECARRMQEQVARQVETSAPEIKKVSQVVTGAFAEVLSTACGDVALALCSAPPSKGGDTEGVPSKSTGVLLLGAFETSDPEKAAAAIKSAAEKSAAAINSVFPAPDDEVAEVVIVKALPAEQYSGNAIQRFQISVKDVAEMDRAVFNTVFGWPLTLEFVTVDKNVLVAVGKNSLEAIKAAIDRGKQAAALPVDKTPNGTFVVKLVRLLGLAKALLATTAADTGADVAQLTAGLSDAPVRAALQMAGDTFSLKLDVPAAGPAALVTLEQRLSRANIRLGEIFESGGKAPAPAPAPPPPPME